MARRGVALLAQQRGALGQQRGSHGAVHGVAQRAVLGHRRVLPQQRAALLGMAAGAGLVDGGLVQHRWARRAVRVVAVAAGHLAEAHGVRRGLLEIGTLLLVARQADLGLRALGAHRVLVGMQLVAVGAGQLVAVVRADVPGTAPLVLVTAQARLVALLHREEGAGLEVVDRQLLVAAARMPCAGAVAGLAL